MAQTVVRLTDYEAYAFQKVSLTTVRDLVACGFSDYDVDTCKRLYISVEDQAVRYRVDGGVPTATTGHPIAADANENILGLTNMQNFQVVSQTGTATVTITLFR